MDYKDGLVRAWHVRCTTAGEFSMYIDTAMSIMGLSIRNNASIRLNDIFAHTNYITRLILAENLRRKSWYTQAKYSNLNISKRKMADGHFEKIGKLPYPSNGSTDCHKIWHDDASTLSPAVCRQLKFWIFRTPRWRTSAILKKNRKIAVSLWRVNGSPRNRARQIYNNISMLFVFPVILNLLLSCNA